MKQNFFLLLKLYIILFFQACEAKKLQNETPIDATQKSLVEIPENQPADLMSSVFEEPKYIVLEATDESLIGNVGEVIFVNDKIVVFDKTSQSVLFFDTEGNYQSKINQQGEGPGEYNRINNIAIEQTAQRIVIASDYKFLWFDFKGNFIKELKTSYAGAEEFEVIDSSTLAIYTFFGHLNADNKKYDIYYINHSGEVTKNYIEVFPEQINSMSMTGLFRSFSRTAHTSELLLTRAYSREILSLAKNKAAVKYEIDFGSKNLPEDYIESSLTDFSIASTDERRARILQNGWTTITGGAILENNDWLQITYGNAYDRNYALYNTETKTASHLYNNNTVNDIDGSKYIVNRWLYQDYFISIVYPSSLEKALEEGVIRYPEKLEQVLEKGNQENPILRLLKPKQ